MQHGFYKSRPIAADIEGHRLAAFTGTKDQVALMTAPGQPVAGVTDSVGAKASYGLVDVQMTDIADLRFGGSVAPGDPITSDGFGRGVKATKPASGQVVWCVGQAQGDYLADDIGKVTVAPFPIFG